MIAFYYGLTGYACVDVLPRELFKSVKNLLFIGVAPDRGGSSRGRSSKSDDRSGRPSELEGGEWWFRFGPPA